MKGCVFRMRKSRKHQEPPINTIYSKYSIHQKYQKPTVQKANTLHEEPKIPVQNHMWTNTVENMQPAPERVYIPCSPGIEHHWIHQPSDSYLFRGDHNCSYNIFPYEVDPKIEIVITGRYPYARYFSLTVIGQVNLFVASAVDHELIPDPGSTNPFLPGANWDAKNRNYTFKIRFTAPPEGSTHFVPGAGNNIIYAGTLANGAPNLHGFIILRVYVASIGYDQITGGVGFPTISYCAARQYKGHLSPARLEAQNSNQISDSFTNYVDFNNYVNTRNSQDMDGSRTCDLTWRTLSRIVEVISPDSNTVYIISDQIQRDLGRLLFIRWKAPTFPDTFHNIGIVANEDTRYWSMTFLTPVGIIGLYTLGDFQTIIDNKGYVNLVISFGAPRPSCVTTENGFTWVDVSHLPLVPLFLEYRNNQISENFPYTAKDVPAGEIVPPEVMRKYYPCGKYVNPMYFDCLDKTHFES